MKKQLLVDMDGVLADVYTQFIAFERAQTGTIYQMEELNGKKEQEAFPHLHTHVNAPGFFRTAPLMADSIEGLHYLNDRYKVLIVSSATEFPNSMTEKLAWLNAHYPFISWQQMIFCGKKDSIIGDIMLDDHPKNLLPFSGERILFTQPHNIYMEVERCKRADNWQQVMQML